MSKYASPRDHLLHFLTAEAGWGKESGNEYARTGWFSTVSVLADDFPVLRTEHPVTLDTVLDSRRDEVLESVVGHFIVQEFDDGRVTVTEYPDADALEAAYDALESEFLDWENRDPDDV